MSPLPDFVSREAIDSLRIRLNPGCPPRWVIPLGWAWAFLLLVGGCLASAATPEPSGAKAFKAGAAVVDISPTNFPVIVNAMFTERTATQTVDRLVVRALVLEEGNLRVAIAVVDTCMMSRELIDQAKTMAHRTTGIPVDRMLVSATHTHSAPSAMACLGSRVDPRYAAFLPGRIADAIRMADGRREPAEVGWGTIDDWKHTFNRRWIRRPDRLMNDPFGKPTVRAHMHPGHESPDAVGPSGPVDPGLSVLGLRTLNGAPLAVFANYSQHYYGSPLLSSDYYGRFADFVARGLGAGPEFVGIMSQGTSGDQMWMDYGAPRRDIGYDAYAKEIADEVLGLLRGMSFRQSAILRMAERKLSLAYRVPDEARLDWARQVKAALGERLPQTQPEIYALEAVHLHERQRTEVVVQALRIGDLGIAAMPNEVYAITGLKVKSWSPLRPTFVVELANGGDGYIPPPEQHVLGGYTTWPARTAGLEVDAEPRITAAVLECLEEVAGQPRRATEEPPGSYTSRILADRPVAFWRLNEIVAPVAVDASGRGRNGTFEPGVALYLPGVGSGEGVSPDPALKPSLFSGPDGLNRSVHFAGGRLRGTVQGVGNEFTVSFWFWNGLPHLTRPVTGYLFSRGRDGDARAAGDHLGIGGTANPEGAGRLFFFNGNARNQVLAGRTFLGERRWHHVALVRSGDRVVVYLDGNPEPEIEGRAELTGTPDAGEFFLGGRCDGFAGLEGKIDEVAVFDRALDGRAVAGQFEASGLPKPAPAPRPMESRPLLPEESLAKIHVPPGYRVELVASEPLLMDPVAIDWDENGRLWVVEMADYPLGMDGRGSPGGRVRILDDTDGDGRMDKSTLFADGLNFPNGILTWRGGVFVTAAPDVLYLQDTDGDGKADRTEVVLSGFLEGNQQLRINGLRWGLDNWVYCAAGGHHRGHASETRVRSTRTGLEIAVGSRDIRFRPDTGEVEAESGPTQFGRNRDDWGHWFGTQNSWPLWHYVLPDRYLRRNPHVAAPDPVHQVVLPMNPRVYPASRQEKRFHSFDQGGHFTSACGGMVYRDDRLFPGMPGMQAFTCEPFHNLVHREVVREHGVSFEASRATGEETSEFFASEDRWCRPVMVRTGPDGALWVVDMVRYMIEHPQWLPVEGQAELMPHYREGDDKGRIYRIVPAGPGSAESPVGFHRLGSLSSTGLVAALNSSNGWLRDKAHQVLLWRKDNGTAPLLERLATQAADARTRVQALGVLDGLGALKPEVVELALHDSQPGVRENALRFAEDRPNSRVVAAAVARVNDPNPKVRLQLALTLGAWTDPAAGEALGRLAVADPGDPFLRAAVLSSAVPHRKALSAAVVASGEPAFGAYLPSLLQIGLGLNDRTVLADLLQPVLGQRKGRYSPEQVAAFLQFLEILNRQGTSVVQLETKGPDPDSLSTVLRQAPRLFEDAERIQTDEGVAPVARVSAASLLTRDPARRSGALASLAGWLAPRAPGETQIAAVRAMASTGDASVPGSLIGAWKGLGPTTRAAVLDALCGRSAWALELARAVASGSVEAQAFDASTRARLLRHGDREVREAASRVFGAVLNSNREEVIAAFRPALALRGDSGRGAAIHGKLCVTCHRRDGQGNDVGPDLRSVVAHASEKLLTSILDPSQDVQPGYHAYTCTLRNGEEYVGIIVAETGNSVVMKLGDGTTRTIRRADIDGLRGSAVSLMPDGLEAGLTVQDLADLIAFLKKP
ncbi:MAG: PVC-type heme-binding CxxCH protein [Limisphaerales bacterium]